MLQGYSFAKFGATYPSAGGLLEYVARGFGAGHIAAITAWLVYSANAIVTAMVAVSFGSYASADVHEREHELGEGLRGPRRGRDDGVNVVGSTVVARVQSLIVFVVVGILGFFAVVTIANMDPSLLAPSGYPGVREIVSSVALTFFAFLGFGVVTFTAKDLADPSRQLPRAMFLALGIATVVYVAIALGVFGTLSVQEVIASGPTAIAVAAKPTLGDAGYWLMSVTALFATAGATNAGLYPAPGLCEHLASRGQFPPVMGGKVRDQAVEWPADRSGRDHRDGALLRPLRDRVDRQRRRADDLRARDRRHLRVWRETGARPWILVLALTVIVVTLLTFIFTTLIHEPASMVTLLAILAVSVGLDLGWTRRRDHRSPVSA